MPAITDYASLVDKVTKYQDREGDAQFIEQIDTFISLSEAGFNRKLKSRFMTATVTLETDADGYATLPLDFTRARSFYTANGNLNQDLSVIASGAIASLFPISSAGIATYVTITNGQFRIQTNAASSVVLEYDQRFVGLSEVNPVNWIITRHPDLYLFTVLAQSAVWLKNYGEATTLGAQAVDVADEIDAMYGMELYNNAGITFEGTTP